MSSMSDSFYIGFPDPEMIGLLNSLENEAAAKAIETHDPLVFALESLLDAINNDKDAKFWFQMEQYNARKVLESAK